MKKFIQIFFICIIAIALTQAFEKKTQLRDEPDIYQYDAEVYDQQDDIEIEDTKPEKKQYNFKGKICYYKPQSTMSQSKKFKAEGINQAISDVIRQNPKWSHGFVNEFVFPKKWKEVRNQGNVETVVANCHIVQNSYNFQISNLPKFPTTVGILNRVLVNDLQSISTNLREFDEKKLFNYDSKAFLQFDYAYGPKTEAAQTHDSTKRSNSGFIYLYIARENPLSVYVSDFHLVDGQKEVTPLKFIQKLNPGMSQESAQKLQQKIQTQLEEMCAYMVFSIYQSLIQKTENFTVVEIQFYTSPKGNITLKKTLFSDIFKSRQNYYPLHQKLYHDTTSEIFKQQIHLVEQRFQEYRKLKTQLQDENTYNHDNFSEQLKSCSIELEYEPLHFKKVVDQKSMTSVLDKYITDQENKNSIYESIYSGYNKKIFCLSSKLEKKNQPFVQWLENNELKNWHILSKSVLWRNNVQRCDIIFTHDRRFYGRSNHDEENNLWNYTPSVNQMHKKSNFSKFITGYDQVNKKFDEHPSITSVDFLPETYEINFGKEEVTQQEKKLLMQTNDERMWIYKPTNMSKGKGIELITDIESFQKEMLTIKKSSKEEMKERKKKGKKKKQQQQADEYEQFDDQDLEDSDDFLDINDKTGILQTYVNNPLTVKNRKFDYRCYVLIASTEPGKELVFFHDGYLRFSGSDYQPLTKEYSNQKKGVHITNMFQQVKVDLITDLEVLQALWGDLEQDLRENQGKSEQEVKDLKIRMKTVLTYIIEAYFSISPKKGGYFQYFGMDVIFDDNLYPYILEGNSSPGIIFPQIPKVVEQNKIFVDGVMQLQTYIQEHGTDDYDSLPIGQLELLIDKQRGYNFIEEHKIYEKRERK